MIQLWDSKTCKWVDYKIPEGVIDYTIFAANVPDHLCIGGPRFTRSLCRMHEEVDVDEAALELRKQARREAHEATLRLREEIAHLARIKRKEVAKKERAEAHARSKRLQAESRARPSPEEAKAIKSSAMVKAAATRAEKRKAIERPDGSTAAERRQVKRREARADKSKEREAARVRAGLLTISEVCEKYGRQKMAVWHACKRGAIEYKVEARALLMPIESVESYIAASKARSDGVKKGKRG
jgi:hypothetical protein